METGFLMLNYKFIRYSDISYEQLTRVKWIQLNSIPTAPIQQLMARFNKDLSVVTSNIPNINQKRAQNQTIAGTPYYNQNPSITDSIVLYQHESRGWSKYCIFSKHDQRFNYEYLKYTGYSP